MENIQIYSKEDLEKKGIDCKQIVKHIIELDTENNLSEIGTENNSRLTDVFKQTSDMWRVIMAGSKIIGYWNCVILNNYHQSQIENGNLCESDINISNLKNDLTKDINNMLFDSICLSKAYQFKRMPAIALIKSIHDAFTNLSNRGIKINKIFGSVWNKDAEKTFKKLGFSFQTNNKPNGKIFSIKFDKFMQNLKPYAAIKIISKT